MSAPRRDGGFTLAEMLVSLALLAVAAALMVQGFSASRGAGRRLQAREEAGEAVAAAEERLRASLEQMVVRARFEREQPYVELAGHDDRLTFRAAPLAGEPPGAAVLRTLRLDRDGTLALVSGEGEDATAEPVDALLKGAARLEIAYWDGAAAGWRGDWTRQPRPPELVRVRVGFPPGDRRFWPELIARPAAAVDAQCVIDGDTGACRGRA